MTTPPRRTGFPGALIVIAVMLAIFAASTHTLWLRLICLVGIATVIAAGAYRMTKGEGRDD
jgi:uncharacterized membrane protein YhaH (DUF805 family)